jgi:gliding motility-associated-like protein
VSGATGGTYTWLPTTGLNTTTGATVTANPTSTTIYTVSWTNASGCSASKTVTVTVSSGATVSITPANSTICAGNSVSITANGGTGGTYSWLPTAGLSSSTTATVVAAPSVTTTYTVSYNNGTCTSSATTTITVNAAPTIAISPTTAAICAGSTGATLTASGGTGGTYTWLPATGLNTTIGATVIATPTSTTNYTVTWTDGICTKTSIRTVSVQSPPVLSVSPLAPSICNGSNTLLTASGGSGGTYSWAPSTGLSATTGSSVIASPTTTTTYTLTWTNGVCTSTLTRTVTVTPPPSISVFPAAPSICPGSSATLVASGGTGGTYTWSPATGLNITTGATVVASPTVNTTYTVTWNNAGCTNTQTVTVSIGASPTVAVTPSAPTICSGGSTTLTANAGTGGTYSWVPTTGLSSTTGASVVASPSATTTYTVTWNSGTGCVGTGTVTVTIGAPPVIVLTASTTTICAGGSGAALNANAGVGGTYTWSPTIGLNTSTGSDVIATPATTRTYTVTWVGGGCTSNTSVTITVQNTPTLLVTPTTATICNGNSTNLTVTGATGGSYTWSPATGLNTTTGATVTANPTATTTYTVNWTNGVCNATITKLVTVQNPPTFSFTTLNICSGNAINVNASGPSGTYSWTGPSGVVSNTNNLNTTPTTTTTYTLNWTNGVCSTTATQLVNVETAPTISIAPTTATICSGGNVTLTASGATGGTYTWTPPTGLNTTTGAVVIASPTTLTTYTVTWTNGTCTKSATRVVVITTPPTITVTPASATICQGNSTNLVASGATGGTYSWAPTTGLSVITGASTTASPTTTTTYTVTWTNSSGCTSTKLVTVTVVPTATIAVAPTTSTICAGGSGVSLVASGATGGTYNWSPSTGLNTTVGTTVIANPTTTTTYTTTWVLSGCSTTTTTQVIVNTAPTIIISPTTATVCVGQATNLTASGGVGGTYTWTPATGLSTTTGAIVSAAPATTTTYTVTWTDGICTKTATRAVVVTTPPTINVTPASPSICSGSSTALTASGATGGVYNWAPPTGLSATSGTTVTANPLTTTEYTITWTGASGCVVTKTVTVTVTSTPAISVTPSTSTICTGSNVLLTASGGGTGGTYTWAPNTSLSASTGSSVTASPSTSTTYTVTWSNASCNATTTVTVTVTTSPAITITPSSATVCSGTSTDLTASGGSGGTYTWAPASTLNVSTGSNVVASPITNTVYTVTWTNGTCTSIKTVAVNVTTPPTITINPTTATICAGGSGVGLTASGATGGTYTWSPPTGLSSTTGAGVTANPSSTTVYTITWTNGACSVNVTKTVTVQTPPTFTLPSKTICKGTSTTVIATGPAGTYTWTGPSGVLSSTATLTVSPTSTTIYTLTWTNGVCTVSTPQTINVQNAPTISIAPTTAQICAGGNVALTASGATGGTYTWSPALGLNITTGANVVASPTTTTNYTVTWTDGVCTKTAIRTVTIIATPTITVTPATSNVCLGSSTTLNASGATGGVYTWLPTTGLSSSTGANVIATPTTNTIYTVTWTNGTLCSASQTATITIIAGPTIAVTPAAPSICAGGSTTLTASGATGGTYTWSPPTGLNTTTGASVTANPSATTTYTVNWVSGGCSSTKTVTVTVGPPPSINITPASAAICPGGSNVLIASGGSGGTYTWSPSAGLNTTSGATVTATPSATTVYTVTWSNGGTCTSASNVTVTVGSPPAITITSPALAICAGGTGTTLTASGGIGGTYTWSPASGLNTTSGATVIATPALTQNYTVTWTNGGCTTIKVITITVQNTPTISVNPTSPLICLGGAATTLTASGGSGGTYTWSPAAGLSATTGIAVNASPTTNTIYTINWTNGVCSASTTKLVTIQTPPTFSFADKTICSGTVTTVNAAGPSGTYSWTGPTGLVSTSSVLSVSPTSNSTYTMNWTNGVCTATATQAIIVQSPPTITTSITFTSVCPGTSSSITASGGTGGTYTWSPSASLNTATGANVIASPSATTVYTVTWTNGLCTVSTTRVITVAASPTIAISPSAPTICAGGTIALTASGVTGGTYTWAPVTGLSATTGAVVSASPTVSTIYTVTWNSGTGCSTTTTIPVTIGTSPTITITPSVATICAGSSVGLVASGASGGTYTWTPSTGLSATTGSSVNATPAVTTTYTVNWTNGSCSGTKTVTITVGSGPVLTITPAPVTICQGDNVLLNVSGATGGTYTWTPAAGLSATTGSSVTASPALTTTYTVNWSNGTGCTGTKTVIVTVTPEPTLSINPSAPSICPGASQSLTVVGGTPGSYSWLPTSGLSSSTGTSITASPTVTTTYTVTWTGATGCTTSKTVTVNVEVAPIPVLNLVASDYALCEGQSFTVDITGDATTTIYDLYIVTPQPCAPACPSVLTSLLGQGNTFTFPAPIGITNYGMIYNYGSGCQVQSNDITISVTDIPNITATPNLSSICPGTTTTLTASGASFGTYTWAPASALVSTTGATVIANPSATTIYTLTWNGGNDCSRQTTTSVTVSPNPTISIANTSLQLCAGSSQTATMTASGGTGGTYSWLPTTGLSSTTGASVTASPSATTVYTATWSNAAGCTSSATSTVTVNPIPTIAITNPNPTLCSGNTGTLTASGMTGGSYMWMPGMLSGATVNVSPTTTTTYTLSWSPVYATPTGCTCPTTVNPVIGASGAYYTNSCFATCAGDAAVSNLCIPANKLTTITITPNPTLSIAPLSPSICVGGSIDLTVNGATGGTYTWSPSASLNTNTGATVTATPTASTTYTVLWSNGLGCTSTQTVTVGVNAPPAISISPANGILCTTGQTLVLTASGGVGGNYTWLPAVGLTGSPGASVVVSPSATTTYTATWSNGVCSSQAEVTVTVASTLAFDLSTDLICSGSTFTKTVSPNIGTFSWSNATGIVSSTNTLTQSPTTTTVYTLNWTDGSCTSEQEYTVEVQDQPVIAIAPANSSICNGESVVLTGNGAIGGTYTWVPSTTLSTNTGQIVTATPSVTTIYTLNWTNGVCNATTQATVVVNAAPAIIINPIAPAICAGESTILIASGPVGGTYAWAPAATLNASTGSNVTAMPSTTTTYSVNWSNGVGCSSSQTVTVNVASSTTLSASPSNATICEGESTTLSVSGGVGGTYTWLPVTGLSSNIGSSVTASPTVSTTYSVQWSNGSGCNATIEIPVTISNSPILTITPPTPSICLGSSVTLTANGATGGTYTWSPSSSLSASSGNTVVANPTTTTTYTVNWSNGAGCFSTSNVTVVVGSVDPLLITPSSPQICTGGNTTLIVSGPTGGAYSWLPTAGLSSSTSNFVVASPASTTTYTVTWSNGLGCSQSQSVTVTVVSTPTLIISPATPNLCEGGSIVLNTTGPASGSYSWLPTTGLITNNSASIVAAPSVTTTYTVTYTNGLGCDATSSVTVTVGTPTIAATATNSTICAGANTLITASGATGGTYTWEPASSLSTSTGTSVTATPMVTTTYTITYSDPSGCLATTTKTIVVTPTTINATTNKYEVCIGSSAALAVSGGVGGVYTWSPAAGLSTTTGPNTTASPSVNTIYTVSWTNGICSSTDTIQVKAINCGGALSLSVTDPCFCMNNADDNMGNNGQFGAIVNIIGGQGPYTLDFSNNAFAYNINNTVNTSADIASLPASTSGITSVTVKFNAGASYTVVVTDANGLIITSEVFGGCTYPTLNLGLDKNVCAGEVVALISTTTGSPLSFNWSTGAIAPSINVTAGAAGSTSTYSLSISDDNGCVMTDDVKVNGINCNVACQDTFYSCVNSFPDEILLCVPTCQLPAGYSIINAESVFECSIGYPNATCVSYGPLPGMPLGYVDQVNIIICNAAGVCQTVVYFVTIGCVADTEHPPVWVNPTTNTPISTQTVTSTLNNCITIPIKATDVDSADVISYAIAQPADGSAWYNADHTAIIYCPAMNACGSDTILLTATDALAPIESDVLTLIINIPCAPPTCSDTVNYCMGTFPNELVICPSFCNITPVNILAQPTFECSIDYDTSGCFVYSPLPGVSNYKDTIQITGTDALGNTEIVYAIVNVSATPCPAGPNATNDNATMVVGGSVTIPVLTNDTYGSPTTVTIVPGSGPDHGYVIVNPSGTVTYVSTDPSFVGVDCFDYQICDNVGCDIATACVTSSPVVVNSPPVAINDTYPIAEGELLTIAPLTNDTDPNGDVLTYTIISGPNHGTLVGTTYNPGTYTGIDSIQYVTCDPAGLCDTAWMIINIADNLTPIIVDTTTGTPIVEIITTIPEDSLFTVCNIGATDSEGELVTITTAGPSNGTFVQNDVTGCWTYVPNPNWNGIDTVYVIACDPADNCDTLPIIINVTPVNDPVLANQDAATIPFNVTTSFNILNNDSAIDGPILPSYITIVSNPANGVVTIDPITGIATYNPNDNFSGLDSFIYSVCITPDNCDTAIVYINVNSNPNPINVVAVTNSDTTILETAIQIPVLANDTITPNTVVTVFTQPTNGMVTLTNGIFTYTPAYQFTGLDSFQYTICDTLFNVCSTAWVYILVENDDLIIYNGFTPDKDGNNDQFSIVGIEKYPNNELMIFNRWGDKVFEKQGYTNTDAWTGEWMSTNKTLPDGTYYYLLYLDRNDKKNTRDGFVVIHRN